MSNRSVADETSDPSVSEELDPQIGIVGAVAIGVGTMIAAGIFVLSGLAVSKVGAVAIGSFLIAAVVAAFTAAAYAEFSSVYNESGGGYMYVANTFDTDLTYIMGWTMILGYPASAAFYLASFSDWFFRFMYPALSIPRALPFWVPGLAILVMLVGINLKGTEESTQFQIVVTTMKVLLLILFLIGGLQGFDSAVIATSVTENIGDLAQIGITSALVFITFFGFSAIATNAEEINDPGRTVPRAIYISMIVVTAIYALVVLVIVLAVNNDLFLQFLADVSPEVASVAEAPDFVAENGEVSMGLAAQYYLGDIGFFVVIVGALFSMLSAANATIMAGSRVKLAMARRDHLPPGFDDIHRSFGTPYKTVLLTGGLILTYMIVFAVVFAPEPGAHDEAAVAALPLGLLLGIEGLAQYANFLLITGLTIVNVALIVNRRKFPDVERGFRVPLVPLVPILAILANLVLLVNVGVVAFVIGLIAETIGVAFWFAFRGREPSIERIERESPTAVAAYESPGKDFTLAVPVANPGHVNQLMNTATTVAAENDGEILVVSVLTVPEQTPLSTARVRAGERREVLDKAMDRARDAEVPVSGVIRIGHDAGEAIVNTTVQHDVDAILIGWQGQLGRRRDVVFGSTVDTVVTESPCDVYVEKIGLEAGGPIESILLPTAGGPHAELAAELARDIAAATNATVDVVNVIDPDADDVEVSRAEALLEKSMAVFTGTGIAVQTRLVEGENVTDALVAETGDYDLTVIGATREGFLQKIMFGSIPQAVAERAQNTVIMTKRHLDLPSQVRQSLSRFRGSRPPVEETIHDESSSADESGSTEDSDEEDEREAVAGSKE